MGFVAVSKECPSCHRECPDVWQCVECRRMFCIYCGDFIPFPPYLPPTCPDCVGVFRGRGEKVSRDDSEDFSQFDTGSDSGSDFSSEYSSSEESSESSYSSSEYSSSSSSAWSDDSECNDLTLQKTPPDNLPTSRLAEIRMISNKYDLNHIARHDVDSRVRMAAVSQMTDKYDLDYVVHHDSDESVRRAARRRLGQE